MRNHFLRLTVLLVLFASFSAHSQAGLIVEGGLIIEVDSIDLAPDSSGTVDVWISSSANDNVDLANYEFEITGGSSTTLLFDAVQDLSEQFDPDYLFAGDSLGLLQNSPLVASTTVEMSDLTASALGVDLDTTRRLLARFDVTHSGGTPAMDEVFTISLLPGNGTDFFPADDETPVPISVATPGTVTVSGASASIPEPSGLTLALLTLALSTTCRRRRDDVER